VIRGIPSKTVPLNAYPGTYKKIVLQAAGSIGK
jgi:hypothetical protein